MRIGVFGGSFDPVHYGHLLLAELCREACELDLVRLVPAAVSPHKLGKDLAPPAARLEMLQLAVSGHPAMEVWDAELTRGGISYTVDTLTELHAERPADELFMLLGADSLQDLPTWRDPEKICELACLVVVSRPGCEPIDFSVLEKVADLERLQLFQQHLVRMPLIELSSSAMRARLSAGKSIRYQTPRAVEAYIEAAQLYRAK